MPAASQNETKLDPALKAKWVEALRSGQYAQTTDSLKDKHGYCCLGVLCHVAADALRDLGNVDVTEGPDRIWITVSSDEGDEAIVQESELPLYVERCIGLKGAASDLMSMNDGKDGFAHHSFPEIADYIERTL